MRRNSQRRSCPRTPRPGRRGPGCPCRWHAHRRDRHRVDRHDHALDPGGEDVETPSPPSVRHRRLAQPGKAGGVEPGRQPGCSRPTARARARQRQRPVRTSRASPARTRRAARSSAASRSSGNTGWPGSRAPTPRRAGRRGARPGHDAVGRWWMPSRVAPWAVPSPPDTRCRSFRRGKCGTARRCGWWRSRGVRGRCSRRPPPSVTVPSCGGPPGSGCRRAPGVEARAHDTVRPERTVARPGRRDLRRDQVSAPSWSSGAPAAPVGQGLV